MSNKGFTLPTGLKAGPLTIDATTNAITTSGNIRATGSGQFVGTNAPGGAVAAAPSTKVKLLFNMNGADNGTTFTDSSSFARTITRYGDTKTSTAQSKFGGASAYFDGTGDYIWAATPTNQTAAFPFGTGSFTIECWVNFSSLPTTGAIRPFCQNDTVGGSSNTKFWFGLQNASGTYYLSLGRHSTSEYARVAWTPSTNTWYHVAVTRKAGVIYLFIDGVKQTVTNSGNLGTVSFTDNGFAVGAISSPYYFHGYIDDFRVITGQAIYTASFTPPTAELTTSIPVPEADVVLLMNMEGNNGSTSFTDSSNYARSLTAYNNAQISTSGSKFGSASARFNGTTGGRIATTGIRLDTSEDFTIEFFINYQANPTTSAYAQVLLLDNIRLIFGDVGFYHELLLDAFSTSGGYTGIISSGFTKTAFSNQWKHVAIVRYSGVTTFYVNGAVGNTSAALNANNAAFVGTDSGKISYSAPTGSLLVGGVSYALNSYIDELRIVKGRAVYTAPFTPPASALTSSI